MPTFEYRGTNRKYKYFTGKIAGENYRIVASVGRYRWSGVELKPVGLPGYYQMKNIITFGKNYGNRNVFDKLSENHVETGVGRPSMEVTEFVTKIRNS